MNAMEPSAMGPSRDATSTRVNVGSRERWVSLAVGGALVTFGLLRSWRSLPWLLLGGAMVARGYTGHSPLYERLGRQRRLPKGRATWPGGRGIRIAEAITINRPVGEVYRAYRDMETLPQFMQHLEVVSPVGERRTLWTARTGGPIPLRLQWEAEIVAERENEMLSWRSVPGSDIDIAGAVLFAPAPGGRGTELRAVLTYIPPGGALGLAVASAFRAVTAQQIKNDLWRFKNVMETGEVPTVAGQPSGREHAPAAEGAPMGSRMAQSPPPVAEPAPVQER
jgi:uncharacterized membrane protein